MSLNSKIKQFKEILSVPRGMLISGVWQIVSFYKNSSALLNENNVEWLARELRILTHTIEKGLSLPIVRNGFGKEKIKSIIKYVDKYIATGDFTYDIEALTGAIAILHRYVAESERYGCDISFIDLDKYKEYYRDDIKEYGVREGESVELLIDLKTVGFEEFAKRRHSIRKFSEDSLDRNLVKQVVELAQTAPSACNRQSSRIIHISDKALCQKVLEIQGGAKGHSTSELLLVVSDLHLYRHISETGTPYLDGGIFLMNLLYALEYYGIGSCPLIWNDYGIKGEEIRNILDIPDNLHIISVVQIGAYPEDGFNYAASKRKMISSVYIDGNSLSK